MMLIYAEGTTNGNTGGLSKWDHKRVVDSLTVWNTLHVTVWNSDALNIQTFQSTATSPLQKVQQCKCGYPQKESGTEMRGIATKDCVEQEARTGKKLKMWGGVDQRLFVDLSSKRRRIFSKSVRRENLDQDDYTRHYSSSHGRVL